MKDGLKGWGGLVEGAVSLHCSRPHGDGREGGRC